MALRKFLYFDENLGFYVEQASSDSLELAGLTMSGHINMSSSGKVTNVANPGSDGDSIRQGGSSWVSFVGMTMTDDIDMNNSRIYNIAEGTASTDGVRKTQVESSVAGSWKAPVLVHAMQSNASQGGSPPSSPSWGVSLVVNSWGDDYDDGDIYEWQGKWVQILANSGGKVPAGTRVRVHNDSLAGSFVGRQYDIGTYNGTSWSFYEAQEGDCFVISSSKCTNSGFIYGCESPGSNVVIARSTGRNGTEYYKGLPAVAAGPGFHYDSSDDDKIAINYKSDGGIWVNGSNEVRVKLSSSSCIYDNSGTLQTRPRWEDCIWATGSGHYIYSVDAPTVARSASGIKAIGLPSQFKINDVATSTDVTQANIDDLTDGTDCDSLHDHESGIVERIEQDNTISETISGGEALTLNPSYAGFCKADCSDSGLDFALGIGRSATTAGNTGPVVKHGVCPSVLTDATAGDLYWLSTEGSLTTTRPGGANTDTLVGVALNSTDLLVCIGYDL